MFITNKETRDRIVYQGLVGGAVGKGRKSFTTVQINKPASELEDEQIGEAEIRLVELSDAIKKYHDGDWEFIDIMITPLPNKTEDTHPNAAIVRLVFEER